MAIKFLEDIDIDGTITVGGNGTFGGNVGIGTASPERKLHVFAGESGGAASNAQSALVLENSTHTYLQFLTPATSESGILFGDTDNDRGALTYSHSSDAMSFRVSASTKMTILSGGNVGIGTTSPNEKLHVNGGITNVVANFESTDAKAYISFKDNTTTNTDTVFLGAEGNNMTFYAGSASSERMRIDSSGNVGIGTTSPGAKLHVADGGGFNVSPPISIKLSHTGYTTTLPTNIDQVSAEIQYIRSYAGTIWKNYLDLRVRGDGGLATNQGGSNIRFFTNSTEVDSLDVERMRIDDAGNVGIGTTSPVSLLEISQQLSTAATIDYPYTISSRDDGNTVNQVGGEGVGIKFRIAGNASTTPGDSLVGASIAAIRESSSDTDSSTGLGLFVTQNDETLDEAVRIDHDGNVGIGTTSPGAKLQVDGGDLVVRDSGNVAIQIISSNSGQSAIQFGDDADANDGRIVYMNATDLMRFFTNDAERMVIDTSGNVGIGTTSPNAKLHITQTTSDFIDLTRDLATDQTWRHAISGAGSFSLYDVTRGADVFTLSTSGNATFAGDVEVRSGNKLILQRPNNGVATEIYTDATGAMVLNSINVEGFDFQNAGVNALGIDASSNATFAGTVTSPTFLGDLNGTINTVTTAVTKANATNDTTVATTAFVQNLIGTIPAGLVFQGTWNAATNTPTLTSGSGTTGHFYIVSTSGSTNLDGVTDWVTGDWAVFIEQGGTDAWEKIDNSSVLDGAGTGQTVALWSGSGTSNTLTDAPITVSGNNTTFAGDVTISKAATPLFKLLDTTNNISLLLGADDANTFIRSSSSANLYLQPGGSTALTLLSGGNVGIGTTSPAYRLQVGDNGVADGNIAMKANGTGADAGAELTFNMNVGGGNADSYIAQIVPISYDSLSSGTHNSLNFKVGTWNNNADAGVSRMTILSNGNVGIGTTNPERILHLDADQGQAIIQLDKGGDKIVSIGTGSSATGADDTILQLLNEGVEKVRIFTEGSSWFNGGNVGIGTTNPSNQLHVHTDTDNVYAIRIEGSTNNASGVWTGLGIGGESTNTKSALLFEDIGLSYARGKLHLCVNNATDQTSATPADAKLTVSNDGNVGIGTTSPGANLDVAGTAPVIRITNTTDPLGNGTVGSFEFFTKDSSTGGTRTVSSIICDNQAGSAVPGGELVFKTSLGGSGSPVATEKMRIGSTGDVGIGATPHTAGSTWRTLYIGSSATIISRQAAVGVDMMLANNHYIDSSNVDKRITAGGTSRLFIQEDTVRFQRAATGIADSNISWTESMRIANNGNVGIGVTNPSGRLQLTAPDVGSVRSYTTASGFGLIFDQYYSAASEPGASYTRTADIVASTGDVSSSQIRFLTKPASANPAVAMLISGNSNVGIGTIAPVSKLQVAGGIQMADDTATASATKVGTMRYRTGTDEPVPVTGIDFITNGNFATDSDWTKSTNATISGGQATFTANSAAQYIIQGSLWSANTLSGQKVLLTYTIVSNNLNAGDFRIGGYTGASAFTLTGLPTTVGTHNVTLDVRTSVGDDNAIDLYITSAATSGTLVIDNVSVVEVTEEDASYADMCMQTGASTYEWVNIVRNTY